MIAEPTKAETKLNQLEQLKEFTKVVADTGDFESIKDFKPQDATTNPSLIFAATQKEQYAHLLEEVLRDRKNSGLSGKEQIEDIIEHLLIKFGTEMLKIIPGRVSTETDARYSFDVEGSIMKARRLIELYKEKGIGPERVLIKVASTWEGLAAAEQLQKEGIRCNMTLLFSLPQAVRAVEVKAQLISPFVGRIYDWYKKENKRDYKGAEDPGVQSVQEIYTGSYTLSLHDALPISGRQTKPSHISSVRRYLRLDQDNVKQAISQEPGKAGILLNAFLGHLPHFLRSCFP